MPRAPTNSLLEEHRKHKDRSDTFEQNTLIKFGTIVKIDKTYKVQVIADGDSDVLLGKNASFPLIHSPEEIAVIYGDIQQLVGRRCKIVATDPSLRQVIYIQIIGEIAVDRDNTDATVVTKGAHAFAPPGGTGV